MPLVTGSHSALAFTRLQFLGQDWTRYSGVSEIIYTPNSDQELLVVTESETGVHTTFWFRVSARDDVWVVDNVVHIPAICLRSAEGDQSKCQRGRETEPRQGARARSARVREPEAIKEEEEEEEAEASPITAPPPAAKRRKVRRKS